MGKTEFCSGEVHESGKWGTQIINLPISDYTKLSFVLMGRHYRYFFMYDALKNIKTEVLYGAPADGVTIGEDFFSINYQTGNKWNCGDGSGTIYYWASK